MKAHLQAEIDHLNAMVIDLANQVEPTVLEAVRAVTERDETLAKRIIDGDNAIDRFEVRIEEECLKILALHQPVAGDLRYVITLLKVNSELERIGDLAVNIAERADDLARLAPVEELPDFTEMVFEVRSMLKKSLDSLVARDSLAAMEVIKHDDVVDTLHRDNCRRLLELIKRHSANADAYLDYLTVSRNLERIADCATNICEDVIYLEQGRIVRHCGG